MPKVKRIQHAPMSFVTSENTAQRRAAENYYHKVENPLDGQNDSELSRLKDGFAAVLERQFNHYEPVEYCNRRSKYIQALSKNEYVEAIIALRTNQIARYANYTPNGYDKGWRIVPVFADPSRSIYSSETSKDIEILAAAIQDLGFGGKLDGKESFSIFLRKCTIDAMVYGQISIEKIKNKMNGKVVRWRHRPSSTIGVLNNESLKSEFAVNGEYPKYFQQIDGAFMGMFYPSEMVFHNTDWDHRDVKSQYGYPTLLKAHTVVEDLDRYMRQVHLFYKQGYQGSKILSFTKAGQQKVDEASRTIRSSLSGTEGSYRVGVIDEGEGAQVLDVSSQIDDSILKLRDNSVRVLCSLFTTSPEEINYPMDDNQVSRDRTGRAADKTISEENGLSPFMQAFADTINNGILGTIANGKFKFVFTGHTPAINRTAHEYYMEAVTKYLTINEIRALAGRSPIPNGDIVLDPLAQDMAVDAAVKVQQMGMPPPSEKSPAISGENKKMLGVSDDW